MSNGNCEEVVGILQKYTCPSCGKERWVKLNYARIKFFTDQDDKEKNEITQKKRLEFNDSHKSQDGNYHTIRLSFDKDLNLTGTNEIYFERKGELSL